MTVEVSEVELREMVRAMGHWVDSMRDCLYRFREFEGIYTKCKASEEMGTALLVRFQALLREATGTPK